METALSRLPAAAQAVARERLRAVGDKARPTSLAREQSFPLSEALAPLFPQGRLRRGLTVAISGVGAMSLGFALVAQASHAGSWTALVGVDDAGLMAAAELGVALERIAVVRPTPAQWAAATAAMVGGFDIVMLAPTHRVTGSDARRLMARSRERGSVLIALQRSPRHRWPEPADLELSLVPLQWQGIGQGHGHVQGRMARIETTGRRDMARPRKCIVVLPNSSGQIDVVDPAIEGASDGVAPMAVGEQR